LSGQFMTAKTVAVKVLTMNGQIVYSAPPKLTSGLYRQQISLSVVSGTYLVEVTVDKQHFTEPILIQR
jgi:hypothetical protein